MIRRPRQPTAPLCAAVLIACSAADEHAASSLRCDDIDAGDGAAVADSAGVAIVVNLAPASRPLVLDAAPRVVIGVTEGDEAYEFGRIAGATRMSDGRIVIADAQAAQLKVFDPAGRFLRVLGARGAGPGEFRSVATIVRVAGDTLWVDDRGNRRMTRLDPNFDVVETIPVAPVQRTVTSAPGARPFTGRIPLRLRGVLADGTLLATHSVTSLRTEEITNVSRDSMILHRLHPGTKRSDSVGMLLGDQGFEFFAPDRSVTFGDAPLGYVESFAAGGNRYYYGDAVDFEVEERAPDGRLRRLIRVCEEPEPIDGERLDEFIEQQLASFSPEELVYEEPAWRGIPRPTQAPSFLELRVDDRDRLWVRDFTYPGEAQRWKLFDAEGRWLAELETPADLMVLEFGESYVLGVHTNELDVQSVRVHALRDGG